MSMSMFKNTENVDIVTAGTAIFCEGDDPNGMMYVLQEGEVDIFVRGKRIDTIGPGECLGEIALVDNGPRSATAMAKIDCKLVPIDAKHFQFLVQQTPIFALQVMETLASRLRADRRH